MHCAPAVLIRRVNNDVTRVLVEWDNSTDSQVVHGISSLDFSPEWGDMGVVATRGPHINDGGWGACWAAFNAESGSCVALFFHLNLLSFMTVLVQSANLVHAVFSSLLQDLGSS
jgi:hypothetical protein